MKHLVTGNAGFIGSWLADALIERGDNVWGADDLSGGDRQHVHRDLQAHGWAKFICTDLAGPFLEGVGHGADCDILWHLAADATEGRSQFTPTSAVHNNVTAYINTLTACIKAWKAAGDIERRKVVLFSSIAVYGDQPPPFDEAMPRRPVDVYGGAKAYMEQITETLADVHGFRYTIIRPHNVFGPRQRLDDPYRNVVGIFMNRIMRGEPLLIYGDGEQRRAFSYIRNSMSCYLLCRGEATDGEIYNVGGMRDISINALAEMVMDGMGRRVEVRHVPDRPREVKEAFATYRKSVEQLGYRDAVSIKEGVRTMAAWAVEQGPQDWRYDPLELDSEKAPEHWRACKPCPATTATRC